MNLTSTRRRRKSSRKASRKNGFVAGFFMPGKAQTLEQFLVASMIQGAFTAGGAVLGTILAKYVLKETDKLVPLPESLHAAISKESG